MEGDDNDNNKPSIAQRECLYNGYTHNHPPIYIYLSKSFAAKVLLWVDTNVRVLQCCGIFEKKTINFDVTAYT